MRYPSFWQRLTVPSLLLSPLAMVFCAAIAVRRALYRWHLLPVWHLAAPVIVVGNISVGGTGKTPLVEYLFAELKARGYRPGIVLRGYGGNSRAWPLAIDARTAAEAAGDEAVLHFVRSGGPVVADPQRARGARLLIERFGCDVVLSDDGLQHYALARDIEILVVDGERRWGNGLCLPAGPLREPRSRRGSVDFIAVQGGPQRGEFGFHLAPVGLRRVDGSAGSVALATWRGVRVHALAAIGNPQRFFDLLRAQGLHVDAHALPDHAPLTPDAIRFDDAPVIMTLKDAVKCRDFAASNHYYVDYAVTVDAALIAAIVEKLPQRTTT